jgi:CheY-like chemotaxis protein
MQRHRATWCSMADLVRVLVVDDQAVVRNATRMLLEATSGFQPIGEAASAVEALAAIKELEPDLVLLDVRLPDMDGIEAAEHVRTGHQPPVVVLMSSDGRAAPRASAAPEFVHKEQLKPSLLRRLWARHAPSS